MTDTCRWMDGLSDAWVARWMFGGIHEVDGWADDGLDRWLVIKLMNKLMEEEHDE